MAESHQKLMQHCKSTTGSSAGGESTCSAGDPSSIPGSGRTAGEGKGYPTPMFWPGEFHGLYHRKSDMTERLSIKYRERKKRKTPINRLTPAFLIYKVLIITPLESQVCLQNK